MSLRRKKLFAFCTCYCAKDAKKAKGAKEERIKQKHFLGALGILGALGASETGTSRRQTPAFKSSESS